MDENDALELANVDFEVLRVSDSSISLATITKVGDELQWPLTKDEPVVKLDALHNLFSLLMEDGNSFSYGVTFLQKQHGDLSFLDAFLKENSLCTSAASSSSSKEVVNWKKFAPAVDEYNSVLARAIAGGTGQIVKEIFICSNANSNQVQRGRSLHISEN
ncbi:senescence/dehydration-associated protein At4g35985, chloroplastic-like, partial [Primulina huaijiensis]|uniref:senescence/dehydration-associated protein At4g35985, chloroplastic-like n=1 Tax=Primulina huaijiensis TaxID=1492673 RepID=UPI003CC7513E